MVLTRQKTTSPRDPSKFPATQLFLLALVRLAEPIALTSIFPYAWRLVIDLDIGSRANASLYSGLLIAAFALAESLTGLHWGGLSDKIGRKPVLMMGCFGTIVSLLSTGLSFNFWVTLLGRFIGGALNGNGGVIQSMVAEIVLDPKHEPKAYAVMPFFWSIGIIVGPAIGGLFAQPTQVFPGTLFDNDLFAKFPYLLPNLFCTGLMLASIVAAYFCLDETHPEKRTWTVAGELPQEDAITTLIPAQGTLNMPATNLASENYGTFNDVSEGPGEEEWNVRPDGTSRPASLGSGSSEKWLTRRIMMLMLSLGIFTYHSMTYDHLQPIFYQDPKIPGGEEVMVMVSTPIANQYGSFAGGLGLSIQQCGAILAFNGIIALFVQAVIFPLVASSWGIWKTFLIVVVLHPIAYFIVPFLVLVPDHMLQPAIYGTLLIRNLLSIVLYPALLILIKGEASPSKSCLGKINGLAASTGAACRTLALPIAGVLYGIGDRIEFTALAWWISALVAVVGALQALTINQRSKGPQHQVRPVAPCRFMPRESMDEARRRKSSVIHIRVERGQDSGYGSEEETERTRFASRVPRG